MDLVALFNKYRKFVVAAAGAAVVILGAVFGETSTEYLTVVSVLTSLGVYAVPNKNG